MAVSSNRSPSPIPARPNPNTRNSESNSTTRRSFSGNPFSRPSVVTNPRSLNPTTPANSPADFARSHGFGKEGVFSSRSHEEKENDNFKALKVRSPAKGSKNFMSPTISAASKFTPSPRKKILTERNEPVRTSVTFSDGKTPFTSMSYPGIADDSDSNSDTVSVSDIKEPVLQNQPATEISATGMISQVTQKESESIPTVDHNFDSISKNSSFCTSPIIAPFDDSHPSRLPYDPKTNYLSPRPEFLHYRPNPRVEFYLNNGKRLEDCLSDAEITEESQSEDSFLESEDVSSDEPQVVSESLPVSTSSDNPFESENRTKTRFFTRFKPISLVFVLLIVCLSIPITDSPVFDSSTVLKNMRFSSIYDPAANIYGFAENFKSRSVNSISSYLFKLILPLGEVDKLEPLKFANLTDLQDEFFVNNWVDSSGDRSEQILEPIEPEPMEEEFEIEELEDDSYHGEDENGNTMEISKHFEPIEPESTKEEVKFEVEIEKMEDDYYQEEGENENSIEILELFGSEIEEINDPESPELVFDHEQTNSFPEISMASEIFQAPETKPEVEIHKLEPQVTQTKPNLLSITKESPSELPYSSSKMASSLLILASMAAAAVYAIVHLKQKNTTKTTLKSTSGQVSPILTKEKPSLRPFSQNWPMEVDVDGGSCPSEMSSFKKVMSGTNEAQSLETKRKKNSRRESLASSSGYSMGSPSYGSFTTYERIPLKNANAEEDVVTPVRRSSRIRSLVTSP